MTPQPQQEYVCNSCEYRCVVKTSCKTPPFVGCIFNSDIGAIWSSRPAPAPEEKPCDHCDFNERDAQMADAIMKAKKAERGRVRPEVWQFALLMEKKLQENDHKEHWSKCNQEYLLKRLDEEVQELHKCFFFYSPGDMNFFMDGQHEDKIPGEAADVANFAMMLWDNFGEKESLRGEP